MKTVVTEINWPHGLDILAEIGEVVYDPDLWRKDDLPQVIRDAEALVIRNQTRVTGTLLQSAPRLKVIGRLGVGLDNIDLDEARTRGIAVVYARNANAVSVAEYVFATMLTFARRPAEAAADVKNGNWNRKGFTGFELYGKTLGLVGTGEIGSRLAVRAGAFGMQLLGYDPFLPPYELAITDLGVRPATLEEVISRSDYISLHVPLTSTTRHLINRETLQLMKPNAYIINSARGGIIDEKALYDVLAANKIAGAALDVFELEPPKNSLLLTLDNVILTPHIAGLTEEAQAKTSLLVAREIVKVLSGQPSACIV